VVERKVSASAVVAGEYFEIKKESDSIAAYAGCHPYCSNYFLTSCISLSSNQSVCNYSNVGYNL
jgi:hypothetical protein